MKNKSLLLLIISVFLLVLTSCISNNSNVDVFSNGETNYTIITPAEASDEVMDLAKELQSLSGANPELKTDKAPESALEILIGDTSRKLTLTYVQKLRDVATTSAFHFIVAEDGGKLVILADTDIGYIYALDYIKETYIKDGSFAISKNAYDIKRVAWDDYYASDLYFNRLIAETDKNIYENEKNQFENEMNRYEDNKGNTIMTLEQAIEQYKAAAAAFNTADFGEYTSTVFTSANTYRAPTFYPESGAHPRILFTENTVDEVRKNLEAPENAHAYKRYITLSDAPCDGKMKPLTGNMSHNYDSGLISQIEAKAFRYAMTGEKIYGYEAIIAAKNAMLTINVPHTVGDWCRTYGYLMYVVACTYDWCYDLLTEEDKTQIIHGCVNLLGMHFEMCCYVSSSNKVPIEQGTMYGHGAEDQLLVDYLSFAIACFDEAPEIYELVAGRILNDYTEAQNFLYQSGSAWEGSFYGAYRMASTIVSNILLNKMTDGAETPFKNLDEVITTMTYYVRPDGQVFRIGDLNENTDEWDYFRISMACFYAGNLYGNAYLKTFAYQDLGSFSDFTVGAGGLTPIQFLAINDPKVTYKYEGDVALTRTTTYPLTNIFAKSANNDKNAFAVYMTMPENYALSHAHMECGSFQIYYKGILASDSGAYTSWGGPHHMGYNMQTISSNSLLIYNPSLAGTHSSYRANLIYCGGQSIAGKRDDLPVTLKDLQSHPGLNQCTSLGKANVEKDGKYLYSYMGGDMTKAYDSVTVDEVTRYMLAVATDDEKCPLVFLTFDRITSDSASYKKTALIHTQEEPTITSDGFAIVTNTKNGNSGKMVVQSVNFGTTYTLVGGEGKECYADGKNLPTNITLCDNSLAEYGWGRIEISPETAEKTNYMLTVMYVTDAENNDAPKKAADISSDNLAGAMMFGKAVLFSKNEKLLSQNASFTLTEGAECFIGGVKAGKWTVSNGAVTETVTVEDGTNLITFTAKTAGTYTITPAN